MTRTPNLLDLLGVPKPAPAPRRKLLRFDDAGEPGFHVVPCTVCGFVGWVECSDRIAMRGIPCPDCYPGSGVTVSIRESAKVPSAPANDDIDELFGLAEDAP